jgi:RHS repeat-associated protein
VKVTSGVAKDKLATIEHAASGAGPAAPPAAVRTVHGYDLQGHLLTVTRNGAEAERLTYGPTGELVSRQVGTKFTFYVGEYMSITASGQAGCSGAGCVPQPGTVEVDDHVLLAGTRIVSVRPSRTLYSYRSRLGTVVATSTGGGVLGAQYRYDPYGKVQVALNETATTASELGYTNGLRLSGSLIYLKARVYDAEARVFLQADSVDRYRYAYVWGDPVNLSDPTGLAPPVATAPDALRKQDNANKAREGTKEAKHGGRNEAPRSDAKTPPDPASRSEKDMGFGSGMQDEPSQANRAARNTTPGESTQETSAIETRRDTIGPLSPELANNSKPKSVTITGGVAALGKVSISITIDKWGQVFLKVNPGVGVSAFGVQASATFDSYSTPVWTADQSYDANMGASAGYLASGGGEATGASINDSGTIITNYGVATPLQVSAGPSLSLNVIRRSGAAPILQ